jgi:hypothetical protein
VSNVSGSNSTRTMIPSTFMREFASGERPKDYGWVHWPFTGWMLVLIWWDQIYVLFLSYGLMKVASLHCHHRLILLAESKSKHSRTCQLSLFISIGIFGLYTCSSITTDRRLISLNNHGSISTHVYTHILFIVLRIKDQCFWWSKLVALISISGEVWGCVLLR